MRVYPLEPRLNDNENTYFELDTELKIQASNASVEISNAAYSQTGSTVTIPALDLTLKVAFDGSVVVRTDFQTGSEAGGVVYGESNMLVGVRVE